MTSSTPTRVTSLMTQSSPGSVPSTAQYEETRNAVLSQRSPEYSQGGTHHGIEFAKENPKKRTRQNSSPRAFTFSDSATSPLHMMNISNSLATLPESPGISSMSKIEGMFTTMLANHTTEMEAIHALTTKVNAMEGQSKLSIEHQERLVQAETQIKKNTHRIEQIENREADRINKERRKDVILHGVPDTIVGQQLEGFVQKVLNMVEIQDFDMAVRKGQVLEDKPRHVVVTLMKEKDKIKALKNKARLRPTEAVKKLDDNKIRLSDQVSDQTLREHHILENIARQLREHSHFAYVPHMLPRQIHYKLGPILDRNDRSTPLKRFTIQDYYAGKSFHICHTQYT